MGGVITRRRLIAIFSSVAALAIGVGIWQRDEGPHYLSLDPAAFAMSFDPPTAAGSAETRRELDELLAMQSSRSRDQVAKARADRKTDIERFLGVLGLDPEDPPDLPQLHRLAERVEDDVRIHVRAVKERFRRLRPYELEPRIEPCIDDVKGDLSYPSGHAAYAFAMVSLLKAMVPERGTQLAARADEFAGQRMMCGVHFRSDLAAGRAAAEELLREMSKVPEFSRDLENATAELRSALGLPPLKPAH
jgi:acid phosphatase (class A)